MLGALRGDAGVTLAHQYRPDAMVVDVGLTVGDGLPALEHLKQHPDTRHIPVLALGADTRRTEAMAAGAVAFLAQPTGDERLRRGAGRTRDVRRAPGSRPAHRRRRRGRAPRAVASCSAARTSTSTPSAPARKRCRCSKGHVDCLVLDLRLPDGSGFDLLERSRATRFRDLPVIVHTGKALTRRDETRLRRYAETIVVKDAASPERLLFETALHLHRQEARLPADKRKMLARVQSADVALPAADGAAGRRRRAQPVRHRQRPRGAAGWACFRRERARGAHDAGRPPRRRRRPARRDDAGDGRLRDHAARSAPRSASPACRSSPSRRRR